MNPTVQVHLFFQQSIFKVGELCDWVESQTAEFFCCGCLFVSETAVSFRCAEISLYGQRSKKKHL